MSYRKKDKNNQTQAILTKKYTVGHRNPSRTRTYRPASAPLRRFNPQSPKRIQKDARSIHKDARNISTNSQSPRTHTRNRPPRLLKGNTNSRVAWASSNFGARKWRALKGNSRFSFVKNVRSQCFRQRDGLKNFKNKPATKQIVQQKKLVDTFDNISPSASGISDHSVDFMNFGVQSTHLTPNPRAIDKDSYNRTHIPANRKPILVVKNPLENISTKINDPKKTINSVKYSHSTHCISTENSNETKTAIVAPPHLITNDNICSFMDKKIDNTQIIMPSKSNYIQHQLKQNEVQENVKRQIQIRQSIEENNLLCQSSTKYEKQEKKRVIIKNTHKIRIKKQQREKELASLRAIIQPLSSSKPFTGTGSLHFYKLGKVLGQGSFGCVRLASHRLTGTKVAIKTYDRDQFQNCSVQAWAQVQREFRQEAAILSTIKHRSIARLYEAFPGASLQKREGQNKFHIVMEFANGGNLSNYIRHQVISEADVRQLAKPLFEAVEYMHSLGIAHRDIKLENMLVDIQPMQKQQNISASICSSLRPNIVIKLTDFGLAIKTPPRQNNTFMCNDHCGTPAYMSPEIVQRRPYRPIPSDVWSLGVALFTMLTGHLPFAQKTEKLLFKKILQGRVSMPGYLSVSVQNLIHCMMTINPRRRATLQDCLAHSWFKQTRYGHEYGKSSKSSKSKSILSCNLKNNTNATRKSKLEIHNFPGDNRSSSPPRWLPSKFTNESFNSRTGGISSISETFGKSITLQVLQMVESFGFNRHLVISSLLDCHHNAMTAAFYLALKAVRKENNKKDRNRSEKNIVGYAVDQNNCKDKNNQRKREINSNEKNAFLQQHIFLSEKESKQSVQNKYKVIQKQSDHRISLKKYPILASNIPKTANKIKVPVKSITKANVESTQQIWNKIQKSTNSPTEGKVKVHCINPQKASNTSKTAKKSKYIIIRREKNEENFIKSRGNIKSSAFRVQKKKKRIGLLELRAALSNPNIGKITNRKEE